jgi:PAS domain S-box-containing protein
LFGYSAEEALGQSVELIVPHHLRAAHWSGFDNAMTKGATKLQGRPTLTRALHKSGRRLYVEMAFAIVKGDIENEVLGAVAVACSQSRNAAAENRLGTNYRAANWEEQFGVTSPRCSLPRLKPRRAAPAGFFYLELANDGVLGFPGQIS